MRRGITLVPRLFSHWWETLEQSHRLLDQHFGRGLRPEQLVSAVLERSPNRLSPYSFYQPWMDWERDNEIGQSIVKSDKDKFRVILDVQQFKPEEVNVKVVDNFIVVEGKHEDKHDDHGIIARHFIRKYLVPDQCDPDKATSSMSEDGILTITAPLKPEAIEKKREKVIKIEHVKKQQAIEDEEPQKMKQSQ
ncbi:protein lethal(2)essential for life-like [Ceratina calcarata]|uniref:Protein lethal(2)essential for life-like n=1 Tax=Ceratina calcarata TaxID=156304 RepID=A0AAJ7J422_9HYME|nr:protein lethal(2)essential for life-like [Ceratina calcarata]